MKLYKGSMQKMGSSSVEDISAMQVNQALGRVYILKFNTDDQKFFIWMQHSFKSEVFPSATLLLYLVVWQSSLMKEEPDASTPFQVFEDMLEDNISSMLARVM
ncbi:26S proteasome regulatory subunit RPN13-like [Populus nigra]|uniref:26S proteasome regulatory subunit RPN13-like n=1 Tax=Populus nigra TaxID=3691 RepID=UPI002B272A88|nr:26S proteasome regulatory subunit RPN13-like [Populus nigra]